MGEMQPQQADWGPHWDTDAAAVLRVAAFACMCACLLHGTLATCCSSPCGLTGLPQMAGPSVQMHCLLLCSPLRLCR